MSPSRSTRRTALLLTAYVILFLPLALVSVRAALTQVPPVLDDVGRSLGRGAGSGAAAGDLAADRARPGCRAALVFISIATELTATLLLVADRHRNARDPLLEPRREHHVRRRCAVRRDDGGDLRANDVPGDRSARALARPDARSQRSQI